jgi:hypothetical protein
LPTSAPLVAYGAGRTQKSSKLSAVSRSRPSDCRVPGDMEFSRAGRTVEGISVKASLFYLPTIGSRAEIEAGMAGMRADLYQRMLRDLSEQIRLADELGYDSVSFTEHHFHIEGFELSNNPVLLDLYFAMQTRRIRVGQLGIVLPAANPIRVAEDIAMLDHMTGGRACAGFARGYQRRWST